MTDAQLKQKEDGSYYFEVSDQSDQYRRQVHPDTGTENDQMWPEVTPEDPLLPLLDLDQLWTSVRAGELITTDEPSSEDQSLSVDERNANIIAKELKYHILATTEQDTPPGSDLEDKQDDEKNEQKSKLKSVYGASIVLKLQYQDRGARKMVPHRRYEELGNFIQNIIEELKQLKQENPNSAKLTFDAIALDLTPTLFARLLDGRETCTKSLEESVQQLLVMCAEEANPKEMHLAIRTFTKKIDSVYMEATSYLVLETLIEIWGTALKRIPRKRHGHLLDFCNAIERMQPCAESYETSFVPDEGVGVEQSGRIDRVPDVLLKFYEGLVKTQLQQHTENDFLNNHVDILGNVKEGMPELFIHNEEKSKKDIKENQMNPDMTIVKDWVLERAITRAQVSLLQAPFWRRLPDPPGEERNIPREKAKRKKNREVNKAKLEEEQKNEQSVARCLKLLQELGWTSPVHVCQTMAKELRLETCSRVEEAMYSHLPGNKRTKKEKKFTLIGLSSIGQYVCGMLRPRTRYLLLHDSSIDVERIDDYKVDLGGSGLDLLTAQYAFDLTLIYVMTIIAQPTIASCMSGIITARALISQLSDDMWNTHDDILRPRCGSRSQGYDASPLGLSHLIVRAVGSLDDPFHRRIGYETLQILISKIDNPATRYCMVENLFMECKRTAVLAQLVTELKDVLIYSNGIALEGKMEVWTKRNDSALRTRFVQTIVPKFFVPRKELLQHINGIVSCANAVLWLVMMDKREAESMEMISNTEKKAELKEIDQRMEFVKAYVESGKKCIGALGAIAHHDRNTMPNSQLAEHSLEEAKAVFQASGRTLNQCMAALSALDIAVEHLNHK